MRNPSSNRAFISLITPLAFLFLLTVPAFAQEVGGAQKSVKDSNQSNRTTDSVTTTPLESQPTVAALSKQNADSSPSSTTPASFSESWRLEIRPYLWLAGVYGNFRVRNTTAEIGKDSSSVLGILDFAVASQVEAIKGRWRIMFDENYVNLGTTGTGPFGNASVEVEPTMNIFEFGGSYTAVAVPNKNATATDPLPPIFTAEILGGGRFVHLGVGLEPANTAPVEGSRNLIGPFIGNRIKISPNKALTLIGKYTVGGSGAGSKFAWSAEGLVDLRLKKGFSLGGGYRALGMNADQASNDVGFDGTMRGLLMSLTLYR